MGFETVFGYADPAIGPVSKPVSGRVAGRALSAPVIDKDLLPRPPAVTGIGPQARVTTDRGPVPAAELRPGDLILTRGHGMQPLRWIGTLQGDRPAAATADSPPAPGLAADLAPEQLFILEHPLNEILFGRDQVLCRAADYHEGAGQGPNSGWIRLLFDQLEYFRVGDVWVESFRPDMADLRILAPAQAAAIQAAVPALRYETGRALLVRDLPRINRRELRMLRASAAPDIPATPAA